MNRAPFYLLLAFILLLGQFVQAEDTDRWQVVSKITSVKLYKETGEERYSLVVTGEAMYLSASIEARIVSTDPSIPTADGIRDYYLMRKNPTNLLASVPTPVSAGCDISRDPKLRGVRIHGSGGNVKVVLLQDALSAEEARKAFYKEAEPVLKESGEKK